eukprot:CAMPEP_0169076162 /NCGR_PEP_ID=MMETSP1015-20121227/8202_1 /TAXON_ID=342587 /ORGANISM="Karlodinium micrum, Strain CCMP2283" /LENGTH=594 /DNA_ID=CAMNT_0009135609 /DNA_START=58 /DNA_END=1842 /DNA_ORIENTATION=+
MASAAVAQTSDFHVLDAEASTISEAFFRKLDADDSGYLSKRELLHARNMMTMGNDTMLEHGLLSDTIVHLLHDIDSDHDNRVSMNEWLDFSRSLFEVLGKKRFTEMVLYWSSTIHKKKAPVRRGSRHDTHNGEHTRHRADRQTATPDLHPSSARKGGHSQLAQAGAHQLRPSTHHDQLRPSTHHGVHGHTAPLRQSPCQSNTTDHIPSSVLSRTGPHSRHPEKRHTYTLRPSSQQSTQTQSSRRAKSPHSHQCLEQQLEEALQEPPPATAEDIWDILTFRGGQRTARLDVDDILLMFDGCRRVGLDMQLRSITPLDKHSEVTPEDLSSGEVAHLCMAIVECRDLTEVEARKKLDLVKDECRKMNGMRDVRAMVAATYGREERYMPLVVFSRFIQLLTVLLQIERTTFLNVIVWLELGWLELSDAMAKLVVETCARKHVKHVHEDPDALWKSLNEVLAKKADTTAKQPDSTSLRFSLNDWVRMVRNCGLNMRQDVMTHIYAHAIHRIQNEAHVRPKRRVDAHGSASDHSRTHREEDLRPLQGRWELERLMEELWKHDSMQKQYISPLAMVTALIIKATHDPLLTPHHNDHAASQG